jgi:malate dehydrogenase
MYWRASRAVLHCCVLQVVPGVPFFASKVLLGPHGVSKVLGVGEMDAFERAAFDAMLPELKGQIAKGVEFASNSPVGAA